MVIPGSSGSLQMLDHCDLCAIGQCLSEGNSNDESNKGGDMPSWLFKEESNREETKKGDPKMKPVQLKKNDNHAVQEGTIVLLDQF